MVGLLAQRNIAIVTTVVTLAAATVMFATSHLHYTSSDVTLIPKVQLTQMQKAIQTHVKLAEKGDSNAMNSLGLMYLRGEVGLNDNKPDIDTAIKYLKKAADKGHSAAQNSVATLYFNGVAGDNDKNYEIANKYFNLAVAQDNVEAMHGLASLYRSGMLDTENKTPDYEKAIALYQRMIDNKDSRGYVNMASMYLNGESFEKNTTKSIQLLEKAKKEKSTLAMKILAQIYSSKDLNPQKKKDITKAANLYKEAIALQDPEAMVALGSLYVNGEYAKKSGKADLISGLNLYNKAASQNYAAAFTNIGNMFYNGYIVEEGQSNLELARAYWGRAASLGDKVSAENLKKYTEEPKITTDNKISASELTNQNNTSESNKK